MDIDSLETVLDYLDRNEVTDERIYARFAPTKVDSLKVQYGRFQRVNSVTYKKNLKRCKKKSGWIAQQRRLKGRCFERMMKSLLPPAFQKWERVQTPTNELDILLVLGPTYRLPAK